jgi:hypothetical protein
MKLFTVLFLIVILSVSLPAQSFKALDNSNLLFYYGHTILGPERTDFAIGVPLFDNNLYYAFYFTRIPGLRLEYKFFNCLFMGFSIRDNKNNYFGAFHYGLKMTRNIRLGLMVVREQPTFELVLSWR